MRLYYAHTDTMTHALPELPWFHCDICHFVLNDMQTLCVIGGVPFDLCTDL